MSAITGDAVPKLPRGVRLKHDAARDAWVVLAPERIITCNPTAVEVLKRIDGGSTVDTIIDDLAACFGADRDRIGRDVCKLLDELLMKQLVQL